MIGQNVLHYRIIEKLGGGGMGVVYKAEDTRLKRQVALKFLPDKLTHDEEAKSRFIHEAQAASALDHPNICNIHEINQTHEDQLFICMTLYQGQTLKKKIQNKNLDTKQILSIAAQLASGLARAHQAGLIHRDLKPANIMLTDHDEIKIVDFGLAKLVGLTEITKEGSLLGTAAYMSPEQTRGDSLDARTDIWSYGVILYELLYGQQPFKGDYEQAVIYSILNESPEPAEKLHADIPERIYQIVDRCLKKDHEERFASVDEILEILSNVFEQVTPTVHIYKPKTTRKKVNILIKYALPLFGLILAAMIVWKVIFSLPDEKHLIILPFKSMNDDAREVTYCAGLTGLLTSRMTQLKQVNPNLQVIPNNVITSLNVTGITDAFDKVGATLAFTGTVNQGENLTQIMINLIDTRAVRQIDSEIIRIDHNLVDSRIEEALISQLASMLELELPNLLRDEIFAASSNRQDAFDYYVIGNGYLEKFEDIKNIDTAVRYFNHALNADRNFTRAQAGLGRAYWLKYEETKDTAYVAPALTACKKAMELNGRYPESYLTCGTIYKGIGQYDNALEKLIHAIQLDPAYVEAYWRLGQTYLALGDTTNAVKTYQQAINIQPGYWQGYSNLGKFYLLSGQYEKAIVQYQQVVDLLPNSERGYYYLGITFFYMEKFDKAVRMAEKAAEISPTYHNLYNLAVYYYYVGDFQAAADKYKKVLDLNQTDHRIWGALGMAYHFTDREDSAKAYFRKALELAKGEQEVNPHNQDILTSLAGYYAHLDASESALNIIKEIEKMNPTNLNIIFEIGDVYEYLGKREKALVWMEKAIRNNYGLARIANNPNLKDLVADERFQKILNEYHSQN
jgi:serine/threonine-protein kinase